MPAPSKLDEILNSVCVATASRSERLQRTWVAIEPFLVSAVQEAVRLTAADAASVANTVGVPLPDDAAEKLSTSAAVLLRSAGRAYVSAAQALAHSADALRSACGSVQS
jgi:hypothetical protein